MSQAVTTRQAKRAWVEGRYERVLVTDATFVVGPDDNISVAAGDLAEIAEAQLGESGDGKLANYSAVVAGQEPFPGAETTRAKPELDLETGADGEAAEGTQVAYFGRKANSGAVSQVNRWVEVAGYESDSGPSRKDRDPIEPRKPYITAPDSLVIVARYEGGAQTLEFANSTLKVPIMAWDGEAPWL